MKKAYLLVFSDTCGTQEQLKVHLNAMDEVIFWRYDLPHSFYFISESSAEILAKQLRQRCGDKGRFIISEITENSFGWLTTESWHLIKQKEHKAKAT